MAERALSLSSCVVMVFGCRCHVYISTHTPPIQSTKHSAVDQFEELVEAREQELAAFQPASRETEADREGDMQSLRRRLDQMLYLLVRKPRSQYHWQMPQGGLEEGESLLQVCSLSTPLLSPPLAVSLCSACRLPDES